MTPRLYDLNSVAGVRQIIAACCHCSNRQQTQMTSIQRSTNCRMTCLLELYEEYSVTL